MLPTRRCDKLCRDTTVIAAGKIVYLLINFLLRFTQPLQTLVSSHVDSFRVISGKGLQGRYMYSTIHLPVA